MSVSDEQIIQDTLRYLSHKRVNGHWLFEEQWVQLQLADLIGALQAGRGLYMDAGFAGESWGLGLFMKGLAGPLSSMVGKARVFDGVATHPLISGQARELFRKLVPKEQLQRVVAHASIATFMCSDMAVGTAMKATEILGEDANDPAVGRREMHA